MKDRAYQEKGKKDVASFASPTGFSCHDVSRYQKWKRTNTADFPAFGFPLDKCTSISDKKNHIQKVFHAIQNETKQYQGKNILTLVMCWITRNNLRGVRLELRDVWWPSLVFVIPNNNTHS